MLYGFCGDCDVCRSASSVMKTSAATKKLAVVPLDDSTNVWLNAW